MIIDTETLVLKSLLGENIIDTEFYLFSSRSSGKKNVGKPRALFVNDAVATKNSPYFAKLLKKEPDVTDGSIVEFTGSLNPDEGVSFEEYGYESDSDLGEEDQEDDGDRVSSRISKGARFASDTNRQILVKGTAFRTWKALVFYLYTRRIKFCNLKSQGDKITEPLECNDEPPSCSPKSMYRLARKIGHEELAGIALRGISERLTKDNVVHESGLFLPRRYPSLLDMVLDVLLANFDSPPVTSALPTLFARIAQGDFSDGPGAAIMAGIYTRVLSKLYTLKREAASTPPSTSTKSARGRPHYV